MAIEPDQLMLSHRWMNLTLEDIQDRHKFLQKTERYITPNPKKPQLSKVFSNLHLVGVSSIPQSKKWKNGRPNANSFPN